MWVPKTWQVKDIGPIEKCLSSCNTHKGMSQVQNAGTRLLSPAQSSNRCTSSKTTGGPSGPWRKSQPLGVLITLQQACQFASVCIWGRWTEILYLLGARAREDAFQRAWLLGVGSTFYFVWNGSSLPSPSLPVPSLLWQPMEMAPAACEARPGELVRW